MEKKGSQLRDGPLKISKINLTPWATKKYPEPQGRLISIL